MCVEVDGQWKEDSNKVAEGENVVTWWHSEVSMMAPAAVVLTGMKHKQVVEQVSSGGTKAFVTTVDNGNLNFDR